MLLKNRIAAVICGCTFVLLPAFSQTNPKAKAEIGIQESAAFFENTNADRTQRSAAVNCGFLGSYRFFLNKRLVAELSYRYKQNTQTYDLDSGSIGAKNTSDGVFAAYVFHLPVNHGSPPRATGAHTFDPKS